MPNKKISFLSWFLLFFLGSVWGSSFILMKKAMLVFSAPEVSALRIFIAFLSLIPFMLFYFREIKFFQWKYLTAVGLLGSGIPAFLFTAAQTKIASALAGILNSLTPLFTLIFGLLFFNAQYSIKKITGVMVGFAGAVLIVLFKADGKFESNFWFSMLIILATMMYATNVNILKKYLNEMHPITITIGAFTVMGPLAGIYLFFSDFPEVMQTNPHSWEAIGYMTLLAVLGTSFSWVLMNILLKNTNALFASMTTYIIPMVAIFWGLNDGETLGVFHFAGMGLIMAGVYLTSR